jgi:glycosyltransferase involved in cell wall biosynthesis
VLRIIARLNIGGPAINAILLTAGLDRNKFETLLITGKVGKNEGDMSYLAQEKGVVPYIIPELGREISWKNDIVALWKIIKIILREKPNIIHTHTAKAGTLGRIAGLIYNLMSPRCYLRGKKSCLLIHTFHGHTFHSYFPIFKSRFIIFIERILAFFTDRIITVSQSLQEEIVHVYSLAPRSKVVGIPLGFELPDPLITRKLAGKLKEELGLSAQTCLVGMVGRLVPVKNHELFLQAIAKLRYDNYCPIRDNQLEIKYVIVGDGELRPYLEYKAKEYAIADQVIFTGWRQDIIKVYADLDLVALSSLNEGLPVALIEAMACGKPVVATDVGGVRDLLLDRGNSGYIPTNNNPLITSRGILIKSGDVYGLSQALKQLIEDKDLRMAMGRAGQKFAYQNFSLDRLIRDMEKLYNELKG